MNEFTEYLERMRELCYRILQDESDDFILEIANLHCKIGNKLYHLNLTWNLNLNEQ